MQQISLILNTFTLPKTESTYINKRDEIIKKAVEHINLLRKGTKYESKIETPARLAKRINMNPFLAGSKNDDTLELLLKDCARKNNYSYLYYCLKWKYYHYLTELVVPELL